jgi:DNA transformation protein and related proteins
MSPQEGPVMAVSRSELAFAEELLCGLGDLSSKRMFGGAGLYSQGVMFAALMDETIYLKADEALKRDLAAEGSAPWIYTYPQGPKAGVSMEMGYMSLPESAMDDPAMACAWARRAVDVALKAQAAKPASRRLGRAGSAP